jgi:uncharacterized protein
MTSFLGSGFSFPWRENVQGNNPSISTEEDKVREAIDALLNTSIGERPHMVRNGIPYGTRIPEMLFENSTAVKDILRYDVERALTVWEPRIIVRDVTFEPRAGLPGERTKVALVVAFQYRATNRIDNFVTPLRTSEDQV